MEHILLERTRYTPKVMFNPTNGELEISGTSIPENANEFYEPLLGHLQRYIQSPQHRTTVNINLAYFNTSSSKWIMLILRKLVELNKMEKKLVVNWYFNKNDTDSYEAGESYEIILKNNCRRHNNDHIEFHYLVS